MLEQMLVEWPGTLLLVSHDRAFLDNVVTSTFAFEGDGRVREYVGGYEDWVRQRAARLKTQPPAAAPLPSTRAAPEAQALPAVKAKKLSYREQRELDGLPARIEALEKERDDLHVRIAGPDFYKEGGDAIAATLARAEVVGQEIDAAYARWHALESRANPSDPQLLRS
jgi:ATP-binding cassette subfamily F protein uup